MMNVSYNDVVFLKDRYVSVGLQHITIPHKLFWFYGTLIDVTETEIKLRMNHGVKIIPLDEIMELKLKEGY